MGVEGILSFSTFLVVNLLLSRCLPLLTNRKCTAMGVMSGVLLCVYLDFVVVGMKHRFRISGAH